jgi:hypothetical protein
MINSRFPLNRPLPADVAASEAPLIRFYQQYPVFSWPWAWRRAVVFGAVGMLAGLSFGASHGLSVRVLWEGIAVGLTNGVANVILVAAGPALGALVRQSGVPRSAERWLIVGAVIAGMAIAVLAAKLASHYHDDLMAMHGRHNVKDMVSAAGWDFHRFMGEVNDTGAVLFVLFIANGGLALATYFAEPKRWAEHLHRVELEEQSAQKSEADLRLAILQAQVEPHFLFNTLASVRSLVSTDPARASQTIDALAEYLRSTLPKFREQSGAAPSSLGEQFAICESYLALMKVRLGDRLRIDVQLAPELRELPFPPLLMISLVENAVTHGVEPKAGVTQVILAARLLEEPGTRQLEVRVEDDGAGLKLGMGEGTGLSNVRAQLRTRFGPAARLELTARSAGGVLARMFVPVEA